MNDDELPLITVTSGPDKVTITVVSPQETSGVTGPGGSPEVRFRASSDGTLMRFLGNGHLH
jgi:hypothetical protein